MLLWLPLQGQAMVSLHGDQQQALAADDGHHACHQSGAADEAPANPSSAGDCHDGNCCYLCHAAMTGLDSASHPLAVGVIRPMPDLRSPSIFFEQPQRPPLA